MTTRNRFNWSAALVWGGLAIFWIVIVWWQFSTWIADNPNLNH